MSKYKPYPAYKDSGIEWLGQVPEHWDNSKLKFLGDSIIGLTYSPDDIVDESEGTIVLRSTNLQNGKVSLHSNVAVKTQIPNKLRTRINDILICSRNGSRALIGKNAKIDLESENMTFGAFTTVFRSENHAFLYWVLNSSLFDYQSGTFLTTTINQLTTGNLNSFETPLPELEEQLAIANFLDRETQKIDALIEKQQTMIELLKEKRQAVISHAVTKGLNPNAPMKDSGIEWLGEVPEHWEAKKGRYVYDLMQTGTTPPTSNQSYFNGDVNWFNPKDLNDEVLLKSEKTLNELAVEERQVKVFPADSVLVVGIGATAGKTSYLKVNATFNQQITGFKANRDNNLFIFYALKSLTSTMLKVAKFTTLPILNNEFFGDFELAIPPRREQDDISAYLTSQTQKIDTLIDKSQQAIELLKERKTALISAAVTGKIDVRMTDE